jgi:hypothetical protein
MSLPLLRHLRDLYLRLVVMPMDGWGLARVGSGRQVSHYSSRQFMYLLRKFREAEGILLRCLNEGSCSCGVLGLTAR